MKKAIYCPSPPSFYLSHKCYNQCCESKYIEFGSGSRILAQFEFGSGSRVLLSVLKEKIKNNFWEKFFLPKKGIFFWNYKNKMSPKDFVSQLNLWIVNLYLKSYTFYLYFILYLSGSGSTTLATIIIYTLPAGEKAMYYLSPQPFSSSKWVTGT